MSQSPSVALVTGGARGIGAALAERIVAQGGQVVVADVDERAGRRSSAGSAVVPGSWPAT